MQGRARQSAGVVQAQVQPVTWPEAMTGVQLAKTWTDEPLAPALSGAAKLVPVSATGTRAGWSAAEAGDTPARVGDPAVTVKLAGLERAAPLGFLTCRVCRPLGTPRRSRLAVNGEVAPEAAMIALGCAEKTTSGLPCDGCRLATLKVTTTGLAPCTPVAGETDWRMAVLEVTLKGSDAE